MYLTCVIGYVIKSIADCFSKYSWNSKELRSALETLISTMCYAKANKHRTLRAERMPTFTNAENLQNTR